MRNAGPALREGSGKLLFPSRRFDAKRVLWGPDLPELNLHRTLVLDGALCGNLVRNVTDFPTGVSFGGRGVAPSPTTVKAVNWYRAG